ncbi:radical SAM/SPASM domain-containing protein [Butyrivibrio fibrisolvens]|uniref:Radical SAM core domain-containing protein n=1 Tax=Butyrivibrio fibrisolvens TaxID=831 RepID=A0A317FXQ6_BUTFI|nr:radical SAM protein [Butyrivibrio fibrisolvens]PWT26514.1 hypothetical protein CPT75_04950 [Butyrivibrio fibrisolvens]
MSLEVIKEIYDKNLSIKLKVYKENDKRIYSIQKTQVPPTNMRCMEQPMYAHISLTDSCNLNCSYCYASDNNCESFMPLDKVKKLIHECDIHNVVSITWTGGEPFTRNDLLDIVKTAHRANIEQTIITNGTLVSDAFICNCPTDGIQFQISLNDLYKQENDMYLKKIFDLVNRFNHSNHAYYLSSVLDPFNISKFECLIRNLIENGVRIVRFGLLMPIGKASKIQYRDYIQEIIAKKEMYFSIREKYKKYIKIIYQFDIKMYNTNNFPRRFLVCEAGTTEMYIDANGDVYPCPLFKSDSSFCCGNVFENDWLSLWNSYPMNQMRNVSECENCKLECKVWCRGLKYFYDGNLNGESYYCLKKG